MKANSSKASAVRRPPHLPSRQNPTSRLRRRPRLMSVAGRRWRKSGKRAARLDYGAPFSRESRSFRPRGRHITKGKFQDECGGRRSWPQKTVLGSASRNAYRATATALNSRGATEMIPFRFMNFKMPLTVSSRDGSGWPQAEASRAA